MSCTACTLLGGLVQDLTRTQVGALEERVYAAGANLFGQGDACTGLYCLSEGAVMMGRYNADNLWLPLAFGKAPFLLGASGIPGGYYGHTAQALTTVRACFVPKHLLANETGELKPGIRWQLMQRIMDELGWAENHLAINPMMTNSQRLKQLLNHLEKTFGEGVNTLSLPLSADTLAQWVGCSRRSLQKHLLELPQLEVKFLTQQ